jgi:hypothetical protein
MCVGLVIEPPYLHTVTLGSPPRKNLGCPQPVCEDGIYECELAWGL